MGKPHKHAELIKAWADGAQIQVQSLLTFDWHDVLNPDWNPTYNYRIKPEEPKPDVLKHVDSKPYFTEYELPVRLQKELGGARTDTELLANLIRSFGYTTWGQSYELATAILQKVGAK